MDGSAYLAGLFTTLGVMARNRLALVSATGAIDSSFNPVMNSMVYSLALCSDGKLMAGGLFTNAAGIARSRVARFSMDSAALNRLSVSQYGDQLIWLRSGSGPEIFWTIFEHSLDGISWTTLGMGSRYVGGWSLTGLSLPFNTLGYVRAIGISIEGIYTASSGVIQSTRQYYNDLSLLPTPTPSISPRLPKRPHQLGHQPQPTLQVPPPPLPRHQVLHLP